MAKSYTYTVSFTPATRTANGYTMMVSLMSGNKQHEITATSFSALENEVRRLAHEFGQTCRPYIRMNGGARKPAGFDKWLDTITVIDYPQPAAAAEVV